LCTSEYEEKNREVLVTCLQGNYFNNEKYNNFSNLFNLNSYIPIHTALVQGSSDFDLRVDEEKLAQYCHVSCHSISLESLNLN
jgi:hypothetical protein